MIDIWHFLEGLFFIALSTWLARLQARANRVSDLELRVVRLETRGETHTETINSLREELTDVRENMVRRADLAPLGQRIDDMLRFVRDNSNNG